MATIVLYANRINQMPGMIQELKQSVVDYKTALFEIRNKAFAINKSVCDLDDVINSIQSSTQLQEEKNIALTTFDQNNECFISEVVQIDNRVADMVRQRKEEFYNQYSYLKPECEKSDWEKFKDKCKSVREWCKEHWVAIVTAVVVVLIAAVALVCGVAVAFIAAVAGIVALALCLADVICMLVTGGKDIATVLRENGFNVLADIFQGLSIGADIVSVIFPLGAALKTITKVGVKTFAKKTIKAAKNAFKEMIEKVFKSGLKDGVKNFGKMTFKSLVVDVDDLRNWKAVPLKMNGPTKNWKIEGDQLIPSSTVIPGKNNPNGLTMEEIMKQSKFSDFPDTIPYKNGSPDMSGFSVITVDINMKNVDFGKHTESVFNGDIIEKKFSELIRKSNFEQANKALPEGITKEGLEELLGYKLTWHEDLAMQKCFLVPTEIHANVGHTGAVSNYKYIFRKIPELSSLLGEKMTQWGMRTALNISIEATF